MVAHPGQAECQQLQVRHQQAERATAAAGDALGKGLKAELAFMQEYDRVTRNRTNAFLALCLLLTAVFSLYTQPEFMMQMANQVWACF